MLIAIDNNGVVKKIIFGCNATPVNSDTIFQIPSGHQINNTTFVDMKTMELKNSTTSRNHYVITEFTQKEVFSLEAL